MAIDTNVFVLNFIIQFLACSRDIALLLVL